MAINMNQVRALCTKSEKELFDSSSAKKIKELTPARLKNKVERSRKLRDKYRDLAEKQRREMRGKQPSHNPGSAKSNDATRTKQQLFQELMERFQAALKDAEAASPAGAAKKVAPKAGSKKSATKKPTTKKKTSKKKVVKKAVTKKSPAGKKVVSKKIRAKKAGTKKAASKKILARKAAKKKAKRKTTLSELAKPSRVQQKYREASTMKIQGHVSSRGRRNQAKRDSKGGR